MELEIYVDAKGDRFKQEFEKDFDIECPFCAVVNKFIIEKGRDLYCSNCTRLMVSIVNRNLVKKKKKTVTAKKKTVGELMEILLSGKFPYERREAAEELAESGDMVCIPALIQASIQDTQKQVRDAAAKALKTLKEKPAKDEFFKDIGPVEDDAVDEITRGHIRFLDTLTEASDMELIMIAKQEQNRFTEEFFDFLETKIERALERKDQAMCDKLAYITKTLDNLKIRKSQKKEEEEEDNNSTPQIASRRSSDTSSIMERKTHLELLKKLINSSDSEIAIIAKNEKEKFNDRFFTFLDRELEDSNLEENTERTNSIIYVIKVLDNLNLRESSEEMPLEEDPRATVRLEEDIFQSPHEYTDFLDKLIASSDIEIITIAKKEKNRFTRRFFDFVESQLQMSIDEENQSRTDSISYLLQILNNLNIKAKELDAEAAKETYFQAEEETYSEAEIEFSSKKENEEKAGEKFLNKQKHIDFLEKLQKSSDIEIIMAAKKEKENFTAEFFEFLDGEIQTALTNEDKERSDNLSYLSQILDNLKVRQSITVTALKTPEKDKRESNSQKADEIPLEVLEEELALMLKNPPLEGRKLSEELEAKIIEFPFASVKDSQKDEEKKDLKASLPPPVAKKDEEKKDLKASLPPPVAKKDEEKKDLKAPLPPPVAKKDEEKKDLKASLPPPVAKKDEEKKDFKAPLPPPVAKKDEEKKDLKASLPPPVAKKDEEKKDLKASLPPPVAKKDEEKKDLKASLPPPVAKKDEEKKDLKASLPPPVAKKDEEKKDLKASLPPPVAKKDEEKKDLKASLPPPVAKKDEEKKDLKTRDSKKAVDNQAILPLLPVPPQEISTKKLKINLDDLGDEVEDYLNMLKKSPLPDDRKNAISSLIFISDERIAPAVGEALLKDNDSDVRVMAAETLVALKDKSVLQVLLQSIKEEKNAEVRKKSAWAYSKLKFAK